MVKNHKKDATASSVELFCSECGSSGAVLLVANVMDSFVPPMLRLFSFGCSGIPVCTGQTMMHEMPRKKPWVHPRTHGADLRIFDNGSLGS